MGEMNFPQTPILLFLIFWVLSLQWRQFIKNKRRGLGGIHSPKNHPRPWLEGVFNYEPWLGMGHAKFRTRALSPACGFGL
jgi:hypothetical protein